MRGGGVAGAIVSPVPRLLRPIAAMLVPVYAAGAARVRRRFDAGRGVVRLDRPVISIGNLSTGGTGKSPMVAWTVARLLAMGRRPCIAMRGYAQRGGRSDEAEEHRASAPGVPVVVGADRLDGLIRLFGEERGTVVDVVVLDDGFQHRRIARDADVVLIDATRDPFDDRLLPLGHLREPVGSLGRATHAVITHAEAVRPEDLAALTRRLRTVYAGPIAHAAHAWSGVTLSRAAGGAFEDAPVDLGWLRGRRAVVTCGIGNPAAFLLACERAGVVVVDRVVMPDHAPCGPAWRRRLREAARTGAPEVVLMTGKDWAKWRNDAWAGAGGLGCDVACPTIRMEIVSGESGLTSGLASALASGDAGG